MLSIQGLNQYYGGSHTLRDVSFDIPMGCTALLGRNGVGKTTLLKCLMGLVPAKSGALMFEGKDITRLTPYARASRALAMQPKLLILDEPTEGIQPSIIKDIERVIRTLAQQGEMAILLVEQYYDFARSLADHYVAVSYTHLTLPTIYSV